MFALTDLIFSIMLALSIDSLIGLISHWKRTDDHATRTEAARLKNERLVTLHSDLVQFGSKNEIKTSQYI